MRILVCDDDKFARDLMSAMLEPLASEVILVKDGTEAIQYVESHDLPDLILMDVIMPGITGYEASEKIKSLTQNKHVPIIFLTALTSEGSLTKCLDYGDDFISKPVSQDVLHAKIRAHSRFVTLYNELQSKNEELTYFYQNTAYEQELVKDIFDSFMERNYLGVNNIRYHISSMSTFNGDLFLVSNSTVGSIYFLIADITGHGLPAAIGTMPVSHTFFSMAKNSISIGKIAEEMNRMVSEFMPASMMCAATLMELSGNGERLVVWSGGMPDALIIDEGGNLNDRIVSNHMPLGALSEDEFCADVSIKNLCLNDKVYVYTDGIIESNNDQGEMFGEGRILDIIESKSDVFTSIVDGVTSFSSGKAQDDDITLVEINAMPIPPCEVGDNLYDGESLPFNLTLSLSSDDLKTLEPVPLIKRMIEAHPKLGAHIDFISTIVSEMFANSLEHGLLKLDSAIKNQEDGFEQYYFERQSRLQSLSNGNIDINLKLSNESELPQLNIKVHDNGGGFDFSAKQNASDEESHGRGIDIIRYFCEKYEYSDEGQCLSVEYALDNEKLHS